MEAQTEDCRIKSDKLEQLGEEFVKVITSKLAPEVKVMEFESTQANLESKEKRMEEEREILNGQTSELRTKTEELLSSSKNIGNEILQLKLKVKSKFEELSRLKTEMASLQKQNDDLIGTLNQVKEETSKHLITSDHRTSKINGQLLELIEDVEKQKDEVAVLRSALKFLFESLLSWQEEEEVGRDENKAGKEDDKETDQE